MAEQRAEQRRMKTIAAAAVITSASDEATPTGPLWRRVLAQCAVGLYGAGQATLDTLVEQLVGKKRRRATPLPEKHLVMQGAFDENSLTKEQRRRLQNAFDIFDKDGSGSIDATELPDLLRFIGQNPTNPEAEALMKDLDLDGDSNISFAEFAAAWWMREQEKADADFHAQLAIAFHVFDQDGNGKIEASELRQMLTTMGDVLSVEEVDEMLALTDTDANGWISKEEFTNMVCWQDFGETPQEREERRTNVV